MKTLVRNLLMLAAVLSVSANALAYDFEVDGIYYNILSEYDKTVRVTYREYSNGTYKSDYSGDVVIPEQVQYNEELYRVTSIGDCAFYYCSSLASVTIPESVTSIKYSAFSGCSGLTSVAIPESVTSIGGWAFSGCSSLTSVTIPESVTSIGGWAFSGCSSLTSVNISDLSAWCRTDFEGNGANPLDYAHNLYLNGVLVTDLVIPKDISEIKPYAFSGGSCITSVTIPEGVTSIGGSAFEGCSSLASVTIPEGVTSIGDSAFDGCSSLTSVTIPEGVTSIGIYAFEGCSSLASVTIPEGVTSIKYSAFEDCSSLASVTIPEGVTSIGIYAFEGCSSLASVTIPKSVTSIGDEAFMGCSSLTSVNISDLSAWCRIDFEDYDANPLYYGHNLYLNGVLVTDLVIPEDVSEIKSYAFSGGSCITTVTIPNSVTSIGNSAFSGCSGLTSMTIPNSVTSIGNSAFSGCSGLTSMTIPNSVTSIGNYALSGCSGLTSVTIPDGVTSIGNYAFSGCSSLKDLTIDDSEEILSLGYNSHSNFGGEGLFYDCPLETVYLGRNLSYSSYESYGYSPFCNTPIKDLTIGNSVTAIGNHAFYNCSSLASVMIGVGVRSIADDAFSDTSVKKAIWLSETPPDDYYEFAKINYVCNDSYRFSNQVVYPLISSMKEINGVRYVPTGESEAAYDVIDYVGNETVITIEEDMNVANILPYAFYDCRGLSSVTIPNSVTTIGDSAFRGCSGLTSVTIGNSVSTIGDSAFSGCSSLSSVSIPNSVTSIGDYAFSDCRSLKDLTIDDSEEILRLGYNYDYSNGLGEGLFYGCPLETVYLGRNLSYPSGSRNGYSPFYRTPIKELTIGNSVTTIGGEAFNGCSGLTSVTIGSGVLFIDTNAFSFTNLKKVVWLPNTPPEGYENVSSARNYVANDSYSGLDNVTVYPYLSSMFEAGGLKYVPVSPSERTCDAIDCSYNNTAENIAIGKTVNYRGIEMTLLDVKDYVCYGNDSIKTLQIKEYAGNIGESSFYGCSNLETVDISDMRGNIGDKAFYDCASLKGIGIPNTVAGIGKSCFSGCSSLEYATIGSGISLLPESCFRGCSSLPEIVIPSTVGGVGNNVFYGCSALTRVDIADRQTELSLGYNSEYSNPDKRPLFSDCPLDSVYIGGNISYGADSDSGYSPFYRNTSLRAVKITDQETEISENEFYGCTGLERVELGDGIESIGNYAFSGCSALESFTFGNSLATIGNEAFSDCTAMTRLVSKTEVPPVCGSQALDDINKWTCELFVPQKSLEAYKAAEQWKEFFFIKGDDSGESSGIDNMGAKEEISVISRNGYIEITGVENQEVEVYNLSGQLVYGGTETTINVPAKGIYIVKVAGQTFKVAL